jgi:hypothetical protein
VSVEWLRRDQIGDRAARRRQVVLTEFQLGHVPAFRQALVDHFGVHGRALPEEPGWFRGPTGAVYEVVLTARTGEPVPCGVEVAALPDRFVALTAAGVNTDLWQFLRWVLERVGQPWTVDALGQLAALYRIPEGQQAAER